MIGAIDSHCHVFDPLRFPFVADAPHRPQLNEAGTAVELGQVLDAHGISNALLVSPTSGHGYDNRCMVHAIATSRGRFKGIARVAPDVKREVLEKLAASGVIGIRLDLLGDGTEMLSHPCLSRLFAMLRELEWQVHVQCESQQLIVAATALRAARLPLVFDHCGRPDPLEANDRAGFKTLLEMGREGHAVKLSGPFRFSREDSPFADVDDAVSALVDVFSPDQCVWGSDWPFIRVARRIDYGPSLACLARWLPDPTARRKVLWDTPARLFGFA